MSFDVFNEVFQYVLIIGLGLLLFGVYSRLGELLGMRPKSVVPHLGIGSRVPKAIRSLFDNTDRDVLAFLSADCTGCLRVVRELEANRELANRVVAVTAPDQAGFSDRLRRLGADVVEDNGSELARAMDLRETPLVVSLDGEMRIRKTTNNGSIQELVTNGLIEHRETAK